MITKNKLWECPDCKRVFYILNTNDICCKNRRVNEFPNYEDYITIVEIDTDKIPMA